jgi:hypothetical protein
VSFVITPGDRSHFDKIIPQMLDSLERLNHWRWQVTIDWSFEPSIAKAYPFVKWSIKPNGEVVKHLRIGQMLTDSDYERIIHEL